MSDTFESELGSLLNKYSLETASSTPDFILAKYLQDCLSAYNKALRRRHTWHTNKTTEVLASCP